MSKINVLKPKYRTNEVLDEIKICLDKGWTGMGFKTIEFEEKWSEWLGTKYSVFVNSGSSSILLTLAALKEFGTLPNNKIVIPSLSWATDVSSPMLLGYDITMCDCNLQDLSCDLTQLEQIFSESNPSVLILVSPLGLVPRMKEVVELCEKYDVILLEDVCVQLVLQN